MKKQFLLLAAAIMLGFTSLLAQDNRPAMQSPEERTKMTMEKLAPLNLNDSSKTKTEAIFKDFYTSVSAAMKEMRESGSMNREAMQAKRDQLVKERDEKLKAVFTEEQLKKWKEEIEPTLRPQKPPRNN